MIPSSQWLLIVNPNAGSGKGRKDSERIKNLLRKNQIDFSERVTNYKGHAISLTTEAIEIGFRRVIIVGGDGTLNETINGIMLNRACSPSCITIGMIPVGTGNDWGRMFGISSNYDLAVKIISDNNTLLHDVGCIKFSEDGLSNERFFINNAGLGFQSIVVRKSNNQKARGKGGKLIYFYNLLSCLLSFRYLKANVLIDNETEFSQDIFSITIGIGRYCGGGMRQTPDANPCDGLFDVTIINKIGKFEIIKNLGLLYDGDILSHPRIDGYQCRSFRVSSQSMIFLDADGETLGHTPVEFSLVERAIRIIYHSKPIA